ncbi:MAG TPA: MaoC family dehydratase [Candidatus Binataceae bacterium]|jgi:acyl dehydratase|nr:MaoC family dehydratase [Candidatus Binataceae bacterium]
MAVETGNRAAPAPQSLTGRDNYFEDFAVGDVYQHARGKTVGEIDNVLITNLVMNTAQAHFNEHSMAANPIGHRITFGGVTASLVIGLAMEDTGEQGLAELALDKIRFRTPVLHGDTLYALSEVLEKRDFDAMAAGRPDLAHYASAEVGEVRFRHWGVNERGEVVFEGERRVLLKRRAFRPRASAPARPARSRATGRGTAAARQKPPAGRAVRARAAAVKKTGARRKPRR